MALSRMYAWLEPRQLPEVVARRLVTTRSVLGKLTEGEPIAVRLLVSTVPVPPMNAVTFGCSVGGAQTGLVPSMSPTQVEAAAWVKSSALVNCATEPLPMPNRPPLTAVQLAARPKVSLATTAYWLGWPLGTQLSCATMVRVPLALT